MSMQGLSSKKFCNPEELNMKQSSVQRLCSACTLPNLYENAHFLLNAWVPDECYVTLEGHVNKQITCFLGFERPAEFLNDLYILNLHFMEQWFQQDGVTARTAE
ncbi:hypothetical protein PR048_015178, partial [Dryococelus australis]